jgi:hypothetical protein
MTLQQKIELAMTLVSLAGWVISWAQRQKFVPARVRKILKKIKLTELDNIAAEAMKLDNPADRRAYAVKLVQDAGHGLGIYITGGQAAYLVELAYNRLRSVTK